MLDPLLYAALGVVDVLLMAHVARWEFALASMADEEKAPCSASPVRPGGRWLAGQAESPHRGNAGQVPNPYAREQGSGT